MDVKIDQLQRRAAHTAGLIALGGGLPAERTFPRAALARAFLEVLRHSPSAALQYDWPEGHEDLRSWIASRLRLRGASVEASDIIVTSGAQQAIGIALTIVLRERNGTTPRVLVDRLSYPAALDAIRAHSAIPVLAEPGYPTSASAIYTMPVVSNPEGRSLDTSERQRLLDSGLPILEDDAYGELRFDGRLPRPLYADAPDRVWQIGTFSKTLSPGLRVGWLVPPRGRVQAALGTKAIEDLQTSSLGQSIVEKYLRQEDYDARLTQLRSFYARRAERLGNALRRWGPRNFEWKPPQGGFAIWVQTDLRGTPAELLSIAVQHGVGFDPGSEFQAEPDGRLCFRLSFTSAPVQAFDEGVQRLGRAIEAWAKRPGSTVRTSAGAPAP